MRSVAKDLRSIGQQACDREFGAIETELARNPRAGLRPRGPDALWRWRVATIG